MKVIYEHPFTVKRAFFTKQASWAGHRAWLKRLALVLKPELAQILDKQGKQKTIRNNVVAELASLLEEQKENAGTVFLKMCFNKIKNTSYTTSTASLRDNGSLQKEFEKLVQFSMYALDNHSEELKSSTMNDIRISAIIVYQISFILILLNIVQEEPETPVQRIIAQFAPQDEVKTLFRDFKTPHHVDLHVESFVQILFREIAANGAAESFVELYGRAKAYYKKYIAGHVMGRWCNTLLDRLNKAHETIRILQNKEKAIQEAHETTKQELIQANSSLKVASEDLISVRCNLHSATLKNKKLLKLACKQNEAITLYKKHFISKQF